MPMAWQARGLKAYVTLNGMKWSEESKESIDTSVVCLPQCDSLTQNSVPVLIEAEIKSLFSLNYGLDGFKNFQDGVKQNRRDVMLTSPNPPTPCNHVTLITL